MTDAPAPPTSKLPLFLAIGCGAVVLLGGGCLGLAVLLGALSLEDEPVIVAAPAPAPTAPVSGEPGLQSSVTTADLVGDWRSGASMSTTYVDAGGNYAGSQTNAYGVSYTLGADGRFTSSFQGISNGHVIREKDDGTWTLAGTKLVLTSSSGRVTGYWFLGYAPNPGGESKLVLLADRYQVEDGTRLYQEVWGRAPR